MYFKGRMHSKSDVSTALVRFIAGLLTEESGLAWNDEPAGGLRLLAPVIPEQSAGGGQAVQPQQFRLWRDTGGGKTETFSVSILNYQLTQRFLLRVADAVYAHFGMITEVVTSQTCNVPPKPNVPGEGTSEAEIESGSPRQENTSKVMTASWKS